MNNNVNIINMNSLHLSEISDIEDIADLVPIKKTKTTEDVDTVDTNIVENVQHLPKIIFYYQTFCGLDSILHPSTPVTHIHLASIHFGYDIDSDNIKYPYIHLNNDKPNNHKFDHVWNQLKDAKEYGIKVILMIGGAGTRISNVIF